MSLRDKQKTNELWKPNHEFAFYWETDVEKCMKNILSGIFNKNEEFGVNAKTARRIIELEFGFKIAALKEGKDADS